MHPAPSLIVFTTLSGLGFGLMIWLGLAPPYAGGWVAAVFAALALALAGGGLLASLFHLGHPERFLKAFSQWRSSWLSREGVLAVATLAAFGVYALGWVFLDATPAWLGGLVAALAAATVIATGMIYGSIRAVPRWHGLATPALFLLWALAGGALLGGEIGWARWLFAALIPAQAAAWWLGDRRFARSGTTLASATGLGTLGRLRAFEPPHTGPNYLLREMVFVIGRRHALKLRVIGLSLAAILPLALMLALEVKHATAGVILLSHLAGAVICRWLFYAEAEHVVGLYYGRR